MTLPAAIADALAGSLGERVVRASAVGGGSINDAWRVELADGRALFIKSRDDAVPGEFAAEAAGLEWIGEGGAVAVPGVLAVGGAGRHGGVREIYPDEIHIPHTSPGTGPTGRETSNSFLALEWIEPGRLDHCGAERLGRELAAMHRLGATSFGWMPAVPEDGRQRIGSLPVPIEKRDDWPGFYGEVRLLPLVELARERGAITARCGRDVERICDRIDDLCGPAEPPARLHGDLWGGNVLAGAGGRAWLIDPAAHGGHRELDLAMLRLFGNPGERVFTAYEEAFPLADGAADRVRLYQLWPLLVHAILFGGGYGERVAIASRHYI
ncbi:MAG: fructosamine kinase family protein [Solirubrobacterales bacterium]